jgi:hypothetical protein
VDPKIINCHTLRTIRIFPPSACRPRYALSDTCLNLCRDVHTGEAEARLTSNMCPPTLSKTYPHDLPSSELVWLHRRWTRRYGSIDALPDRFAQTVSDAELWRLAATDAQIEQYSMLSTVYAQQNCHSPHDGNACSAYRESSPASMEWHVGILAPACIAECKQLLIET